MVPVDSQTDLSNPMLHSHPGAKLAYWKQHVEAWQKSGLSQRAYGLKHNLALSSFSYWQRKLNPGHRASKSQFASVKVSPVQTTTPVRLVHPNGFVIECSAGTDVVWLQSLMGLNHAS